MCIATVIFQYCNYCLLKADSLESISYVAKLNEEPIVRKQRGIRLFDLFLANIKTIEGKISEETL